MTTTGRHYLTHLKAQRALWILVFQVGSRISGVIVNKLALSVIDSWFEPQSDQNKDYKIGNHAVLRSKRKDWLSCNQDNVFMQGMTDITR